MESKQRTPLALAIEELKAKRDLYSPNGNLTIRSIRGAYVDAIVILESLKPKEREMLESAYKKISFFTSAEYFDNNLTQE